MATIQVQVDGHDNPLVLELSLDSLTLRESVRLQKQIGNARFDRMVETGNIELRPDFIQALVYSKLKTQLPDIEIDSFDLDAAEVMDHIARFDEDDEGKAGSAG